MDISRSSSIVSIGGILTALAVLFQSAPVFLPGIGLMLSPFATLPIALAMMLSIKIGLPVYLASGLILLMIDPQEAVILMMATGLLGLALGAGQHIDAVAKDKRYAKIKKWIYSVLICTAALFAGIMLLKNILGLAVFGGLTPESSIAYETFIFFIFALMYSIVWVFIIRFFARILKKLDLSWLGHH